MKSLVALFFLSLSPLTSENVSVWPVYYGYPASDVHLKTGDLIILNLPKNLHGRFYESPEIKDLVTFVNRYADLKLRITLYFSLESAEFNLKLTEKLRQSLVKILEKQAADTNYTVVGAGSNNPIFLDQDSPTFIWINTRLEILVE